MTTEEKKDSENEDGQINLFPREELSIIFYVDSLWTTEDIKNFYSSIQNLYDYYTYYLILQKGLSKIDYDSKLALALVYSKIFESETILISFPELIHTFHKSTDIKKRLLVPPLRIKQIKYSSPGFHDIIGVGAIVGHMKDILFKVIEIFQTSNIRKLEIKKMEIENEILSIDRDNKIIQTYKELGFNNPQIVQILNYEFKNVSTVIDLIEEKKITNIN